MLNCIIKNFAKSLTEVEEERYRKCYIIKANLQVFSVCNEKYDYKIYIEKTNHRFSEIISEGYFNNFLMSKLTIYLVDFKTSKEKLIPREEKIISSLEFWNNISKEKIVEFSKYTNDKNLIHLEDKPIVQGLMILMELAKLIKESNEITIKFIRPIYSDEDIYIKNEHNAILGYVNNVLCFKCNFKNI